MADGLVRVAGQVATKPATAVTADTPVLVDTPAGPTYVSRGAHKLAGALDAFGYDPSGRRVLDAGASTGGFTDLLLQRGAEHVFAVDVGYGQLAWSLQTDDRVTVVDRTNVRALAPEQLGERVSLVVADLSFIPLGIVLPALVRCTVDDGDLLPMVKPRFEVGRERLPSGGVVRDPALRAETVRAVAGQAAQLGLGVRGVVASPLPGPNGNVEFFLWLRRGAPPLEEEALQEAVRQGPQ
ncbi:MAG: rRNA (cytidine-2-O)-methyltransferase [Frankiales bacterium]|nr:rRNA (cytidine-2-O)-methyltransferase [Frankiales bacterium]